MIKNINEYVINYIIQSEIFLFDSIIQCNVKMLPIMLDM